MSHIDLSDKMEDQLVYYDFVQIGLRRNAGYNWGQIAEDYKGDFDHSLIRDTYTRWQRQRANYEEVIRTINKADFKKMMRTVGTTDITVSALTQFSYFLNYSVLRDASEWLTLLRADHLRARMSSIGPAFKHCNTKWTDMMWDDFYMIKRLIEIIESV